MYRVQGEEQNTAGALPRGRVGAVASWAAAMPVGKLAGKAGVLLTSTGGLAASLGVPWGPEAPALGNSLQ